MPPVLLHQLCPICLNWSPSWTLVPCWWLLWLPIHSPAIKQYWAHSSICHPTYTPALEQSKTTTSPRGEVPKIMLSMDIGQSSSRNGIQPGTWLLTRMWRFLDLGLACPQLHGLLISIHFLCTEFPLLMAHVLTVIQQTSQFSNLTCYHSISSGRW